MFALGILTGIAICTFIAILFAIFYRDINIITKKTVRKLDINKSMGTMGRPKTDLQRAKERLFDSNNDFNIDDLL